MKRFLLRVFDILFGMDVHVRFLYRLSHTLYRKVPVAGFCLAQVVRHFLRIYSSCDISPRARIGKNLTLPHPLGIVIGRDVVIGDNVTLFQHVTLGSHGKHDEFANKLPPAYPVVEDNVRIYPGSTVIGGVNIGKNAQIGAHSLVLCDVPQGCTAVGAPARILPRKDNHE